MNFLLNLMLTMMIAILLLGYLYLIFRKKPKESKEVIEPYDFTYLLQCVQESFNEILNINFGEYNLKAEEREKREKLRMNLKKALRTCSYGNVGEKEYVKDYIKMLLQQKYGVNEDTIDFVIPFERQSELTVVDQFDIILYCYKKEYGPLAVEKLIETYELDRPVEKEDGYVYEITKEQIEEIYEEERISLLFPDKMNLVAQRIYQAYKGHGVIDELRDMRIDGLSGGVSGLGNVSYNYLEEVMRESPSNLNNEYQSIWIFYHRKTIHLSFLGFGTQKELERICKNIYRYNHPGQLSASNGYKVNDLYDNSRVVVVRPPFAESWAFFLRKFDTSLNAEIQDLVVGEGADTAIEVMKWLVKGCQVIGVTGEQGSGKTTLLKSLIRFIDPTYTLRIQELVFETHLRNIYPNRNIISFQETAGVSGQEALDLQKKTDGAVNILGEVASAAVASWVVQLSQVGTKMTIFTNHAVSTEKLIEYFRNSLLSMNIFHDEKIAEEQVVDAIHFDIHIEKDKYGRRFIQRITEIIHRPPQYKEKSSLRESMKAYLDFQMKQHCYEVRDILIFEDGIYQMKNPISESRRKEILKNLTVEEEKEFLQFMEKKEEKEVRCKKNKSYDFWSNQNEFNEVTGYET